MGPANLPDETEIDRLRDPLPANAKDMLMGITKEIKAWETLNQRFGDKELISTKLKAELKGLTFSEDLDHEKMISFYIKVRSLVLRLEKMGAFESLKHNGEFVSVIYFQLPERQKSSGKFNKVGYGDKWSALVAFLDVAYG